MSERLTTSRSLRPSDVVLVAVQLRDKSTGQPYWWKRFACVIRTHGRHAELLSLRMQLDLDKDLRMVDFDRDVVTKVEQADWPQGVVAMRMKWITKGVIPLGEADLT